MSVDFPGSGHNYLADFGAFRVKLSFASSTSLTYFALAPDGTTAATETVAIAVQPIAADVFLVTWQEADKTTVVHIEDFGQKTIITNITNPDLTFEQHRGVFSEIVREPGNVAALGYDHDIKPLFRDRDVACMNPRRIPLRDPNWMCVPANAALVYARLFNKTMPKDGPWPPERIAMFKQWMDEGCNP
jgi:hypothetical protein